MARLRDPWRTSLARISHTFCDTEAIRSEKVSRCKSLTAAGQADPFRQSVFQPSAGRLMDIGLPPQSASVFRAKCSPLAQCEKCGLNSRLPGFDHSTGLSKVTA